MTVFRVRLSKEALLQIPDDQRKLFLALAHFMNEASILLRSFVWSYDITSEKEAHVHGQIATSLCFQRLLAGKLSEGWQLLQKHFFGKKALADLFARRASDVQKAALDSLKSYFGKSNIIHSIRNNFAFHYSPEALDDALPNLPDKLDLYVEKRGITNTLYYFAEALASRALFDSVEAEDMGEAMGRVRQEVEHVARHFIRFSQSFMSVVLKEHKPNIWQDEAAPVDLGELPAFLDVRFPWFTDASDVVDGDLGA